MTTTNSLGLTTSQAASYLGVSLSTVRRWADAGHLETRRTPGGQRRFTESSLEAFLAATVAGGGAAPRAPADD